MAIPVVAGAIFEFQLRYQLQGQQCINVFHYLSGGGYDLSDAVRDEFMAEFDSLIAQPIGTVQTTECVNRRIRIQLVHPTRYVAHERASVQAAGTQPAPTLSIGTAVVVRRRSELANRSARGRVYIGGCPVAYAVLGTLTAGGIAAIELAVGSNWVEGLDSVAVPTTLDPVIWSYADPLTTNLIISTPLDPNLRYQRRREVGRGQ